MEKNPSGILVYGGNLGDSKGVHKETLPKLRVLVYYKKKTLSPGGSCTVKHFNQLMQFINLPDA